ncbi:hypothetical protein IJF93_02880 [Candidatus Saccharibacteria bacterium]|nr:hypothetical protein [Candidatus Saccharibacteria bacterium]
MNEVRRTKKRHYALWLFFVATVVATVVVVLNRGWIYDFYRGMSYQPTAEMSEIKERLNLTSRGAFVFDATWPELKSQDEFNLHCRTSDMGAAILGCYTEGNIYVYNIEDEELNGIRELTTAHELLHAVYARMSDGEKEKLEPVLKRVYEANLDTLEADVSTYGESEKLEEIYVRAGTEIKKLPDVLEQNYAEIFANQDNVVDFYESYIAVFKEVEAKMEALGDELTTMKAGLEATIVEYERRFAQLNADIVSFNSCADVAGCFKTEEEFEARRQQIVDEHDALNAMYNELNDLIEIYNVKVEEYNSNAMRGRELNRIINSSAKPDGVN